MNTEMKALGLALDEAEVLADGPGETAEDARAVTNAAAVLRHGQTIMRRILNGSVPVKGTAERAEKLVRRALAEGYDSPPYCELAEWAFDLRSMRR